MRIAMKLCYDGTNYCGWQIQPNGVSIQSVVESAITKAFNLNERVKISASGRTDAGVHAFCQICHCDIDDSITTPIDKFAFVINRLLPDDIKILQCAKVSDDFHAQHSTKKKTYRYSFYISEQCVPLIDRYALQIDNELDFDKMKALSGLFLGEHDFKSMCAARSSVKSTVREIYSINISVEYIYSIKKINIDFCGNGFLYNMVRTLAGQFLAVGSNTKSIEEIEKAFNSNSRNDFARTLKAKGLTLINVDYNLHIFN